MAYKECNLGETLFSNNPSILNNIIIILQKQKMKVKMAKIF